MATITKTRRNVKPITRSIQVISRYTGRGFGRLRIVRADVAKVYLYTRTPAADGVVYGLRETDDTGAPQGELYTVALSPTHGHECNCPAGRQGRACKHCTGCAALELHDAQRPGPIGCVGA